MTADGQARLLELLGGLYGREAAPGLLARLASLLDPWRSRIPHRELQDLTQRDSILIVYPDQVQEPGTRPLQTLADFCRRRLSGLVTGIHLLPFYPSSSDDGFSVIDHRAVDPALGTWEDVAELGQGFRLVFDAVVNHASIRSEAFRGFLAGEERWRESFVTVEGNPDLGRVVRPRTLPLITSFDGIAGERRVWTTFSADQADWNYRNPQVVLEILDVLLHSIWRGAQVLRLDAVAYLWKEIGTACIHLPQTHRLVQLFRAVLNEAAPHVVLLTETNVPHADNLAYFGDGLNEAQLAYNFALPPLVLHALQNQTSAFLAPWAAGLRVPGERTAFVNFLASHDGIGLNPVRGLLPESEIEALVRHTRERGGRVSMRAGPGGGEVPYELNINYLDALGVPGNGESPAVVSNRFLTAQAVMLALAGLPAIYFHSLFGSRGWNEGVEQTGSYRAVNRERLIRGELERGLGEADSLRARVFRGMEKLLRARAASPAFHPAAGQRVLDCGPQVFGLLRQSSAGGQRVICLHNLSGVRQYVALSAAEVGPDEGGDWQDLLGSGAASPARVELAAWQTRWLASTDGFPRAWSSREAQSSRGATSSQGAG